MIYTQNIRCTHMVHFLNSLPRIWYGQFDFDFDLVGWLRNTYQVETSQSPQVGYR